MIKSALHRTVLHIERGVDRLRGQSDHRRIIEPYIGYATPEHLVVRGRVLTALRRNKAKPTQSKWINFLQMLSLFATDEVAAVKVTAGQVSALTDEEGYFTLLVPRNHDSGWASIDVHVADEAVAKPCPVLVPDPDAAFGVISDIDDTMLETGAYSLSRNLWTSLTGNALTRQVFPDAVRFMDHVSQSGRNPVFYVSSSPWNLHDFLEQIFARFGLVRGPTFLRDLGISETQFITGTHGDHKGSSIDAILAANPGLRFILAGDTGQHDAFVYRDAIARHPDRILAVVLREPGPGPDAESRAAMEEIRQSGVALLHGKDFGTFAETITAMTGSSPDDKRSAAL